MPVSLLSTKFYIPHPRANGVSRPRLSEKLLAGVNQPGGFVLISGPAGFGKTTLLSEFVAQLQWPVAWVSLDEGDNDPVRFWSYLIAACQSVQAGIGASALELIHTSQPPPADMISTILINDLARLTGPLVLILDDYHAIQNPSLQAAFVFLLEHLPDKLHIVLSTRSDPPWPLARFRARNQLTELRAADLRFTTAEAAAFLNRMTGLDLPPEAVAALEARTEGWIAGLQLAALSMKGRSDIAGFVAAFSGSHLYVAEYLVEEVLQRQPESVQAFLLRTSLLERLNAGLCETVAECQDGQAMLAALQRANLFVIPLDDDGQWFRYHHLFADLLQARLRQATPAEGLAALHRRAAAWYEQHGFAVEAVDHALAAKDYEGAARLVEQNASLLMTRGELATFLQWIAALPAEVTRRHPLIILAKAWALTLAGARQQVEALLQELEAQIAAGGQVPSDELVGNAAAMRAFFAMLAGDYARALELAERAEALLPQSSVRERSLLPYTLGSAYRGQGQYEKAAEAFVRLARMGEAYHDLLVWATGMTEVVNVRRLQGRLREAGAAGRQALQHLAALGAQPFGSLAKLEVALSEVLREQNELEEARRRLTDVIGRMQTWDMPTDRLFAYLTLTHVQQSQGDFASARETLRLAADLKTTQPVLLFLARAVDSYEIRLALDTHDVATAAHLLDHLAPAGPAQPGASPAVMTREQDQLLVARVRLAQGQAAEAAALLASFIREAEAAEHQGAVLEGLALQACALEAQGEREAAVAVLLRALALAEPEGFVRLFVDEGKVMQSLLADAARQMARAPAPRPSGAYVAKLLDAYPANPSSAGAPPSRGAAAGLVEPLTARELEVLRLIAAGDSNRLISDKLVITVSAVKKHTGHIFGKLNVNSRTQAVARARQLGLLPASD